MMSRPSSNYRKTAIGLVLKVSEYINRDANQDFLVPGGPRHQDRSTHVEITQLGRTGLKVSRLCLGTMNFGPSEPAQVALAWLLHQPAVTAPVVGPGTLAHLKAVLRAVDIRLDGAALARLDQIWAGPGPAPESYAW
jgi:aldo/keto reductase family protein